MSNGERRPWIGMNAHHLFDQRFQSSHRPLVHPSRSPLVDLKKEAISVSKFIENLKIVKIDRQANKVVHEIAKFSFDSRSDDVLCNSVSPCVGNYVMNDCKNLVN
ncbi:uncharacterized protein [Triticum aestivum]|uniref:uncharacterized protein n=1 Tax=Triticum aestivum TaxID=4565 RepID=UPI001D026E8A|nr:uncharacterized protein LOC123170215 [Triticum aestivum]